MSLQWANWTITKDKVCFKLQHEHMPVIVFKFDDECGKQYEGPVVGAIGFHGQANGYYRYAHSESQKKNGKNKLY